MSTGLRDYRLTHNKICALDAEIRKAHEEGGEALVAAMKRMSGQKVCTGTHVH